jgi:hypothetical protein
MVLLSAKLTTERIAREMRLTSRSRRGPASRIPAHSRP